MTRIEGFLRTLSPVHQTRPGVTGYLDHTSGGFPYVSLVKKNKGRCAPQNVSPNFDHAGSRPDIPIVSGASVRGRVRRLAARHLFRALNQPVRADLFHCITAGSASRQDIGGAQTAVVLSKGRENIFAGLFGGGGSALPGGLVPGDLFPITSQTEHLVPQWVKDVGGIIGQGTKRDGEAYDQRLTHVYATIKRDPLLDGEGVGFVADHDGEFMAAQERVLQAAKKKKSAPAEAGEDADAAAEGAGGDLRMMSYTEAIIPGVALNFSMQIKPYLRDYHVGLLLMALLDWVNEQELGGGDRRGWGRFEPNLKLFDESGSDPVAVDVFLPTEVDGSRSGYHLNPALAPYLQAAADELGKQSIALLEDLMLSKKSKKS